MVVKGGKAIASGGFGCVFRPALKCNGKTDRTSGVSKLMTKKNAEDEYKELTQFIPILEKIPNYEKYFLIKGLSICSPGILDFSDLENITKCTNFSQSLITKINDNITKFKIINLPDGGKTLSDVFKHRITNNRLIEINNNMINLLLNAIIPMNDLELIHNDLKGDNILVNNDNLPKIIDWGLSSYKYKPYKNLERPIHFNLPFSTIIPGFHNTTDLNDIVLFKDKVQNIDYNLLFDYVVKTNVDELYLLEGQTGHYNYLNNYFIPILNSVCKGEKHTYNDYVKSYLTKILKKFTIFKVDGDTYKYIFETKKYISEVYRKNADIWGFITCYQGFIYHDNNITSNGRLIDNNKYQEIRNKVCEMFKYLYDTAAEPIDPQKIIELIKEINAILGENKNISQSVKQAFARCPKGTRRNKKTGNCDPIQDKKKELQVLSQKTVTVRHNTVKHTAKRRRCPNGTRRNPKTGNCDPVKK